MVLPDPAEAETRILLPRWWMASHWLSLNREFIGLAGKVSKVIAGLLSHQSLCLLPYLLLFQFGLELDP